jgi:hypothetical protein
VASLGTELTAVVLYAAWALAEPVVVALLGLAIAAALPRLLRLSPSADDPRWGRSRRSRRE